MKKVSFDVLIQFIGMAGVIASLIFVGLEMRQSQQIALAAQQQSRTQVWSEMTNVYTEKGISMYEMMFNLLGSDSMNESETLISHNWLFQRVLIFESDYVQFLAGLIEESVWEAKLSGMRSMYNNCKNREVIEFFMPWVHEDLGVLLSNEENQLCASV